jgi:hypothetical protein
MLRYRAWQVAVGREFFATHARHGQHTRRSELHVRHRDIQSIVVPKIGGKRAQVVRLGHEVQLVEQAAAQLGDPVHQAVAATHFRMALRGDRHAFKRIEIIADASTDTRPLHLDDHFVAVGQNDRVHLCQRAGRKRHRIEMPEQLFRRRAEFRRHHAAYGVRADRRHIVLDTRQLGQISAVHQIGPARQGLPQLDECRSQRFQVVDEALRRHALRRLYRPRDAAQHARATVAQGKHGNTRVALEATHVRAAFVRPQAITSPRLPFGLRLAADVWTPCHWFDSPPRVLRKNASAST